MAASRERRANAGSRMSRLLNDEEDEFYKSTYGGFEEAEEDDDFDDVAVGAGVASDSSDSDISIDEDDEVRSDMEDDDKPIRKKKVYIKTYKPPPSDDKEKPKRSKPKPRPPIVPVDYGPRSMRQSTLTKSKEATAIQQRDQELRERARQEAERRRLLAAEVRKLNQQDLMREAKETEKINLESLENYYKMELEKKRVRPSKTVIHGPRIRYHSWTVPLIQELPEESMEINVTEESDTNSVTNTEKVRNLPPEEKCSRTFISFTDDADFRKAFKLGHRADRPYRRFCPVTRRAAKYFDPVTQTPYRDMVSFKYLRKVLKQQLEDEDESKPSTPSGGSPKPALTRTGSAPVLFSLGK